MVMKVCYPMQATPDALSAPDAERSDDSDDDLQDQRTAVVGRQPGCGVDSDPSRDAPCNVDWCAMYEALRTFPRKSNTVRNFFRRSSDLGLLCHLVLAVGDAL